MPESQEEQQRRRRRCRRLTPPQKEVENCGRDSDTTCNY
jgi:hypothetical protein